MFGEFVHEALTILLAATLLLAWGWTSFVGLFDTARSLHGYVLLAFTAALGFVVYSLSKKYLNLAVAIYILALLATILVVVNAYDDNDLLTLLLLVVLVAAPLTQPMGLGIVTLLVLATMVATAGLRSATFAELALPLMLTTLTALTAWLSTRRLFTALEWALNMTAHAQRSAEEARSHRSELQRVLHSLDLALSRLERSNRALIFAQEAAEKAYRFKSEFVANVSHELRTPLNLIVGFSEMMTTAPESYGGKPLPGEYRGDMLAIYRSSRHLLDLINDVLDLSQIESGRVVMQKERVRLQELIQETVDIVRGLAEARKLQLIVDPIAEHCEVELDRIRIRQVLLNLLTNAMRYTEQGWLRVSVEIADTDVTILVQDSGRGIAPEKLKRAFEAFDRLDERELTHGSGLGLALSKKFVELHQGRIWIASVLGEGTTVGFSLPLPTTVERLPLSSPRVAQPLRDADERPLVLVIHDDVRIVGLLRRHISKSDFVLAENVADTAMLLRELAPDLVLVDTASISTWEMLVARGGAPASMPVLSAPLPSTHQFGESLGASDYLPKPVTREDVAYVLRRLNCRPANALVIDDDPHIVRLIGRMLRSLAPGIHVTEAFDGAEALDVARLHSPDVIFVDLNMPAMSGQQFIEVARTDPNLVATPIIVVSVRNVEQEMAPIQGELCIRCERGFALSELLGLIETVLGGITRLGATSLSSAAAHRATPAD